jgi:SAM-dependent methyltransferase
MGSRQALYDRIGSSYSASRATDQRIGAAIRSALGDAETVVNVGAGTGAYEPADLDVVAIEPSAVMIAQRPEGSARVLCASAEAIPLADNSVDAAMAVISDHHWSDRRQGLREMRRVARGRVVVVNTDPSLADAFWLTREYLRSFAELIPDRYRVPGYWERELDELLGKTAIEVLPVPHDCQDGFYQAYWRRPEAYLRREVRTNISAFRLLPQREVQEAVRRLATDLRTGAWLKRHQLLSATDALDVGLRIVISHPS